MRSGTQTSSFIVQTSVTQPSSKRSDPRARPRDPRQQRQGRVGLHPSRIRRSRGRRPRDLCSHNLAELDPDPAAAGFTVEVSGHSHKPVIEKRGKILFVNPAVPVRGASSCR